MESKETGSTAKYSIITLLGLLAVLGFGYCTESVADHKQLEAYRSILEEQMTSFTKICLDKNHAMRPDPKEKDRQGNLFSCSDEGRALRNQYNRLLSSLGCGNAKAPADRPCPVTGKPIDVQALNLSLGGIVGEVGGKLKEEEESEMAESQPALSKEYSASCFPGAEQEDKCRFASQVSVQRKLLPQERREREKTSIKRPTARSANEATRPLLDSYRSISQLSKEFLNRTCPPPVQSTVMKDLCRPGAVEGQGLARKLVKKGDILFPDLKVLENKNGLILVEASNGDVCWAPFQRFPLENVLLELIQTEKTYQTNMGLLSKGGLPREFTVYKKDEGFVKGDADKNKLLKPCVGRPVMECLFINGQVSKKDLELFNRIYGDASRDASDVYKKMSSSSRTTRDPSSLVSIMSDHLSKPSVALNFAAAAESGEKFRKIFERLKSKNNANEIIEAYEYNVFNPDSDREKPNAALIGPILIQPVQRATRYPLLAKSMIDLASNQQAKRNTTKIEPFRIKADTIENLNRMHSVLRDGIEVINEGGVKERVLMAREKMADAYSKMSDRLEILKANLVKFKTRQNNAKAREIEEKQAAFLKGMAGLHKSSQLADDAEITYARALGERKAKASQLSDAKFEVENFEKHYSLRTNLHVEQPKSNGLEDAIRMQFKLAEVKAEKAAAKAAVEAKEKAAEEALAKATQIEEEKKAELDRLHRELSSGVDTYIGQLKK